MSEPNGAYRPGVRRSPVESPSSTATRRPRTSTTTARDHLVADGSQSSSGVCARREAPSGRLRRSPGPPTDLQLERLVYEVARPLPPEVVITPVVAWFGQPGGGVMVSLDRSVRAYVESGALLAFTLDAVT
ncbi:MAG: glycohydrolase toxin TNT-related protein [Janthinobacterium lividum]